MTTLEERVSQLENQVRHLLGDRKPGERTAGWEAVLGTFADSDGFDEAVRLGREYRESLRPRGYKASK